MIYLNKKLANLYVREWFEINSNTEINDWNDDVYMEIVKFYFCNEFERQNYNEKHVDKLYSLIKNDPVYVRNYKQWQETNALNQIKRDFV